MLRGIVSIILAVISFLSLAALGLAALFLSLPDVRNLKGCVTTELYHVHLCESDSTYTEFPRINSNIIGAVIMSEDASFYSHQGVDLYEMKESVKKDLNQLRFARGASTITQQLAKNVYLSKSKNIFRKLEEIYLALQIEKYFTKQKILTLYLNVVEFGDNIYGVKQACRHYFNKEPHDVTPEQAAFLAFLLPNPKKYSQSFQHRKLTPFAQKMIRTILHKMMLGKKVSEEEYQAALTRIPLFPWNGIIPAASGTGSGAEGAEVSTGAPATTGSDSVEPAMSDGGSPDNDDQFKDESNTDDDDFKFDFSPEEN